MLQKKNQCEKCSYYKNVKLLPNNVPALASVFIKRDEYITQYLYTKRIFLAVQKMQHTFPLSRKWNIWVGSWPTILTRPDNLPFTG